MQLVENKLELRNNKWKFLQSSVKYLAYTIDGNGIKADIKGLKAIRDFPIPDKQHSAKSAIFRQSPSRCMTSLKTIGNFRLGEII